MGSGEQWLNKSVAFTITESAQYLQIACNVCNLILFQGERSIIEDLKLDTKTILSAGVIRHDCRRYPKQ